MRYEILNEQGEVTQTILADEAFVEAKFPGRWRAAPATIQGPSVISVLAFRSRFTMDEKIAIYTAAKSSVEIQIWLDDLAAAQNSEVSLHDPRTVDGVQSLEAAGLLAEGRAAEILT